MQTGSRPPFITPGYNSRTAKPLARKELGALTLNTNEPTCQQMVADGSKWLQWNQVSPGLVAGGISWGQWLHLGAIGAKWLQLVPGA